MSSTLSLSPLTISPTSPHTHTIIFLHGRGDSAPNLSASLSYSRDSHARTLFAHSPSFKWVFPTAPVRRCASSPAVWPQWFDVWDVRDFSARELEISAPGLSEVVPALRELILEEVEKLGGRGWERVILAGISMGAATGAHTMINLDLPEGGRLGGFLGFSGRSPLVGRTLKEMRGVLGIEDVPGHDDVMKGTPMLLEHCVDDPLVLIERGRNLRDGLRSFGAQVEWREYSSGGHWFNSPSGIDDAVDFINRRILGTENSAANDSERPQATVPDAIEIV